MLLKRVGSRQTPKFSHLPLSFDSVMLLLLHHPDIQLGSSFSLDGHPGSSLWTSVATTVSIGVFALNSLAKHHRLGRPAMPHQLRSWSVRTRFV